MTLKFESELKYVYSTPFQIGEILRYEHDAIRQLFEAGFPLEVTDPAIKQCGWQYQNAPTWGHCWQYRAIVGGTLDGSKRYHTRIANAAPKLTVLNAKHPLLKDPTKIDYIASWIKVQDRLPPAGQRVLGWSETPGTYHDHHFITEHIGNGIWLFGLPITHWMSLSTPSSKRPLK